MEPVSLGFGIAGAISASISIGTALKKLTHQYRDAPDSYTFTIKQCSAVNGQLALLQSLMLKETWSKQLGSDGETSDYFVTIVMNCAENLQELEACVGSIRLGLLDADARLNVKQKAKVVWKDDDLRTLLGRLETSKEDIGRVLTILQAESLARIETQMEQLRKSMNTLARSNTTKYRAMRVPGGGVGGRESTVVVVPSTYPGAPPKEAVAGSGVSLADIDLASVVLMTASDEPSGFPGFLNGGSVRKRQVAESIRSILPTTGGVFSGQMKALVELVEQDIVSMQQKLTNAEKASKEHKEKIMRLEERLIHQDDETKNVVDKVTSEIQEKLAAMDREYRHYRSGSQKAAHETAQQHKLEISRISSELGAARNIQDKMKQKINGIENALSKAEGENQNLLEEKEKLESQLQTKSLELMQIIHNLEMEIKEIRLHEVEIPAQKYKETLQLLKNNHEEEIKEIRSKENARAQRYENNTQLLKSQHEIEINMIRNKEKALAQQYETYIQQLTKGHEEEIKNFKDKDNARAQNYETDIQLLKDYHKKNIKDVVHDFQNAAEEEKSHYVSMIKHLEIQLDEAKNIREEETRQKEKKANDSEKVFKAMEDLYLEEIRLLAKRQQLTQWLSEQMTEDGKEDIAPSLPLHQEPLTPPTTPKSATRPKSTEPSVQIQGQNGKASVTSKDPPRGDANSTVKTRKTKTDKKKNLSGFSQAQMSRGGKDQDG